MSDQFRPPEQGTLHTLREIGGHDELIARDGHYAAMFNTQARRYR